MSFRTEIDFENSLVDMLIKQKGWNGGVIKNPTEEDLIENWAEILFQMNNEKDRLNGIPLIKEEINQIIQEINSLNTPLLKNDFINGGSILFRRETTEDYGKIVTLKLFDKKEIAGGDSNYQVVQQPLFSGNNNIKGDKRGDVMLLINGMPLIHIELKRRGTPLSSAVNQIQRYIYNGVFSKGIYSLIQVFVAMTPDKMCYFANPGLSSTSKINQNYIFEWADFNNNPINNWKRIADSFLSIPAAHQLIGYYTIADKSDNVLKVLRSYQIYAIREILNRMYKIRWHDKSQLGGYIWHTTGSGKTLTSFKAAELIATYGTADKVVFLMDRVELGTQTLNEFKSFADFSEDVQGTQNTDDLYDKLRSNKASDTLIVTSIQKMSNVAKMNYGINTSDDLQKRKIVIIIDEAHRSTFGEMLYSIKEAFPEAIFFGFTGTPIHDENQRKDSTTATVFGEELHRYSLSDGIRDKNVLGFDITQVSTIDYNYLREKVALYEANAKHVSEIYKDTKKIEIYNYYKDHKKVPILGYRDKNNKYHKGIETDYLTNKYFEEEDHHKQVVKDILENWMHLSNGGEYSAILATSSREEAIKYYRLMRDNYLDINITALFDSNLNESEKSIFIEDGLAEIIEDYNKLYKTKYTISTHNHFKKDISYRLAQKGSYRNIKDESKIHLVIVVDQLLTGYDSKWINTLYFDRLMEYHNIIQAFSRTNRLNGDSKPFGSIRYYRRIYQMEKNINNAVESYSGGREIGLFVDKLGGNLIKMNHITEYIHSVFSTENIKNFERLPNEITSQQKFAQLFNKFNQHLEAAFVQGFSWDKKEYLTMVSPEEVETKITINFDQEKYDAWSQRYLELCYSDDNDPESNVLSFDLNYDLIEKNVDRIDFEYLNSNFKRYIESHERPNPDEQMRIKNDLHRSFATLSLEEQVYANMVINDLENGELLIEEDKDFMDYINDYRNRSENNNINKVVNALGVNEKLLREMLNLNITKDNINEFGRFDKLKETIDKKLARSYFIKRLNNEIKIPEVNRMVDTFLRKFLQDNTIDIDKFLKGE